MPNPAQDGQPAKKRPRLTPEEKEARTREEAENKKKREELKAEEKEARAREEAEKKRKREELKAEREAKQAAADLEKQARQQEREAKRKQKEQQKEQKEQQKEQQKLELQKKDRSQQKLNMFFKAAGPSTPKKTGGGLIVEAAGGPSPATTPSKHAPAAGSDYDRMFQPFFIKQNVTLARGCFELDDETREAKTRILDEYLQGKRGPWSPTRLNSSLAVEYFHYPTPPKRRGRSYPSVQKILSILADAEGTKAAPVDLTADSKNSHLAAAREMLRKVPIKFISFKEDVRPAYRGTISSAPSSRLAKLGRRPTSRDVLPLNYEYDSEAEWVDDEGEDIEDLDDEEEDAEEDEEMADFLDDSEDAGPSRPPAYISGMEPESTGLRWENCQQFGPTPFMSKFRLEFILGKNSEAEPSMSR